MQHYRFWVFDLDGTLTVHQHDFDAIREELDVPPGTLILEYLEQVAAAEATRIRTRLERWEHDLAHEAQAAEGAAHIVETLAGRGAELGILTRNTRRNALIALEAIGLSGFFAPDNVLGRDEAAPKPSPAGVHHLLSRWQAHADAAIMVGDFRLDLEAGRNAGIATVHVAPGEADAWPQLTDYRFHSLVALAATLHSAPS